MYTPDWIVYPGVVVNAATGSSTNTGTTNALKRAIEWSDPEGAVIEVNGVLGRVEIGIGENWRKHQVVRKDPIRVTIVAGPDHQSIKGGFAWGNKKAPGGPAGYAVEHLELVGLTIDARQSQNPLAGFMDNEFGDIILRGLTMLSAAPTTKWGCRIHGQARSVLIEDCHFDQGGEEHPWYIDHAKGDIIVRRNTAKGWKRTGVQVVTREKPGSAGITRPVSNGDLIIEDNVFTDCGAHGASSITVTGWPRGKVRIRRNVIASKYKTGAIVLYKDPKQGKLLTPDGYAVRDVIVKDNHVYLPNTDRDCIAIGSCGLVKIKYSSKANCSVVSNKAAFDLKKNGQENAMIGLYARIDPNNWNLQTYAPTWKMDDSIMTPAEVSNLWVAR